MYLHNAAGKIIASKMFELVNGSNRLTWNMQHLIPGNYFLSATRAGFKTIKVIKK